MYWILSKMKNGKKIIMSLIVAFLLMMNIGNVFANNQEYFNYHVGNNIQVEQSVESWRQRDCDVIIRVGEWGNETTVKDGKRVYIDEGVSWKRIPTDIPIRTDEQGGHFISEWDINKKIATRVYEELRDKGVNAKLQVANGKSQDLNASARISNESNPKIYLSIHTNSWQSNSTGYFSMYNQGNETAKNIAKRFSNSISNNGMIHQVSDRANDGYIGELNHLNNSTIGVLMEMGYFSGTKGNGDLYYIMSDRYADYVAEHLSDEIINVLGDYWN